MPKEKDLLWQQSAGDGFGADHLLFWQRCLFRTSRPCPWPSSDWGRLAVGRAADGRAGVTRKTAAAARLESMLFKKCRR